MGKFITMVKLFVRTPGVIVPYALLLAFINVSLYQVAGAFAKAVGDSGQVADTMYFFGDVCLVSFGLFLFFLFVAYEYMRKVRGAQMEEVLSSYGKSGLGTYLRQFGVLVLSAILVSANVSIYFLWGWGSLPHEGELLGEVIRLLFVNVFLLSLGAVSMGTILSGIKNRFAGYAIILLVLVMMMPNAASYFETLQVEYHVPIFFFRDLLCLVPPDLWAVPDPLYAFPLEDYRMAGMAFWVAGAILLLMWKLFQKEGKLRCAATISLCLLMGFFLYQTESRGSVLLVDGHPDSGLALQRYYNGAVCEGTAKEEEGADFAISRYELDMKIGKELEVGAWMTLAPGQDLSEYHFTLNHEYAVKEVASQDGSPLAYSRDGDYLNVRAGTGGLSRIFISYKGHSSVFYANRKACFLPGFFAYYPKAGYQKVYGDTRGFAYNKEPASVFEVTIDREGMVSNLVKTDSGFRGEAETMTLIDGYYRISQEGGSRVVSYPLMESQVRGNMAMLRELPAEVGKLREYLGLTEEEFGWGLPETVFMVPGGLMFNSMTKGIYQYGDYALICDSAGAVDVLEYQLGRNITPEKELLYNEYFSYQIDERFDEVWGADEWSLYREGSGFEGYENEEEEIHDVFLMKLKELGTGNFAGRVVRYLLDGDNHMDSLAFLESMGNGG